MAFYNNNTIPYNGLPVNYQTPVPYQQQYPQAQQSAHNAQIATNHISSGIIWVQGEAGAKAYPVAPGNSVLLMDSESECFYIKSTDSSGVPLPLRTFTYAEIVQTQKQNQEVSTERYVTQEELDQLKQEFKQALAELQSHRTTRKDNRNEQTIPRNSAKQPNE